MDTEVLTHGPAAVTDWVLNGKVIPRNSKLEVGSGNNPWPGYLHADIDPSLPELDIVCSLHDIPAPANWFSVVRSVHSIEHVSYATARKALLEWYRILMPGGKVYVDTPNINRNVRMYIDGTWTKDFDILTPDQQRICSMHGLPDRTLWLNFKIFSDDDNPTAWNLHRWNADPVLLCSMFRDAGFRNVDVVAEDPSLIVTGVK